MKNFFFLTGILISVAFLQAQTPDNWNLDTGIETFQENTIVFGGLASCGVIVKSDQQQNCDLINTSAIEVNEGIDFYFSFQAITSQHVRVSALLDWEGAAMTLTGVYVGPGTNEWTKYEFSGSVPAGATAVNIMLRFYDVIGFSAPETQYIDDVQFESPIGEVLPLANGNFEDWQTTKPEPSSYPTEFATFVNGLDAVLSWFDAGGETMPDAYLILISTRNDIANPVDSIYVADDLNLADSLGAANVVFGAQTFTFSGLQPLADYYFKIFPYTNAGTNINFKTDGTVPATFSQTSYVVTILNENFDENWDGWEVLNITGDQEWDRNNNWGMNQTACANINGFENGNPYQNEDWLISPAINLENYYNNWVAFYLAVGLPSSLPQLTAKISADYDGGGNPATATWDDLNLVLPEGNPDFVWTYSGNIDITDYTGNTVNIAFVYESNTNHASIWWVDNILITGESIYLPEPTNYPSFFAATPGEHDITLTWNDATGMIVPAGYLVKASNQNNIIYPQDGIPETDDLNLNDGEGTVNVPFGVKSFTFTGPQTSTTYYFTIFPFINTGENIDFKTGDLPPLVSATTFAPPIEEIFLSTFDLSWENWQQVNISGDQGWNRDNTVGIGATSCALISGNVGTISENEDWLISPAINLTNFTNEKLSFFSASESLETDLQVKISTDYDGSENPGSFTWNDISDQVLWPEADSLMNWGYSGEIDIADFGADTLFVAFVYNYFGSEPASCKIDNFLIVGENHTGIGEYNCEDVVNIFPNPANGVFTINMEKPYTQVEVYSTTGIYLLTKPISENLIRIDLSQLPDGFYLLKFTNEKSGLFFTKKIEIN